MEPTPEPIEVQTPQPEVTPVAPAQEPVAAPVAAEPTKSWTNDDGIFNRDRFSDDLGKHSMFDKYPNVEEFVKGALNQNKLIGQKVEDFWNSEDPTVMAKKAELLGVPKSSDDYEILYPESFEGLPDENKDAINEYLSDSAKWAHEMGVPKELFEKFVTRDLERAIDVRQKQIEAADNAFNEAQGELKKEWRNEYDNNVDKTINMAKVLEMDELIPYLESNPDLMKNFYNGASKIMSDDTIIEAKQIQSAQTTTDQLSSNLEQMGKLDPNSPEYDRLVRSNQDLMKRIPDSSEFGVMG